MRHDEILQQKLSKCPDHSPVSSTALRTVLTQNISPIAFLCFFVQSTTSFVPISHIKSNHLKIVSEQLKAAPGDMCVCV